MKNDPLWRARLPITRDLGLVQCEFHRVVEEYIRWHQSEGLEYSKREIVDGIQAGFSALEPVSHILTRRLFVQTDSDWVAFFQNGHRGSDSYLTMSRLARRLDVLAMRVCVAQEADDWPAEIWEVYASQSRGGGPLGHRRTITAADDGGRWVYDESGDPFPFEDPSARREKKVRDRFTTDHLVKYLQHFRVRADDSSFLRVSAAQPAILLERITPLRSRIPEANKRVEATSGTRPEI